MSGCESKVELQPVDSLHSEIPRRYSYGVSGLNKDTCLIVKRDNWLETYEFSKTAIHPNY